MVFGNFLKTWLVTPRPHREGYVYWFWFAASMAMAGIYAVAVFHQAFASEFVVSDDARQHVFWMQRFIDPALFPNDLIANYFQSVAPVGYTLFYRVFAHLGIEPLLLSKLIPPLLGLITAGSCFFLCLEIFPVPAAGFLASALLTQNIWMRDDLASGTPRAFLNPLFLCFLYYLIRRSFWCFVMLVAIGLFYPQYVLVSAGILVLTPLGWANGKIKIHLENREYWFCILGLAIAFFVLLPYALKTSEFGPTITAAQARLMPEFLPGGRVRFFYDDFGRYWLTGGRSGMQIPFDPPLLAVGLLFPIVLQFPHRFPLAKQVRSHLGMLGHLTLSSLFLFFAAHTFLFKLHLPSRYTQHSLRVVMSLSAAIAIVIILEAILRGLQDFNRSEWQLKTGLFYLFLIFLIFCFLTLYPLSLSNYPKTNYHFGSTPELYRFFERQPQDISIASISSEANNIPTFAHRSIISGQEYAIPYHLGYYRRFQSRTLDLIQAQYAENLLELQNFIQKYDVNFWVLERDTFTPEYIEKNAWMKQYPSATKPAFKTLESGGTPAFQRAIERCPKFQIESFTVVPTECILNMSEFGKENALP